MSSNPSNKIILASAGSRKTTYIVEEALLCKNEKVLILTYTIENINQIRNYIIYKVGYIPINITIQSWYSFLLQECIKPYQNFIYEEKRIESIFYPKDINSFKNVRRYIKKENIKSYFLIKGKYIINEHISEFTTICNKKSNGKVISRLEGIYSKIFIDEVQDVSGYDFDVIELLLKSKINCLFVGDCRQATYFTTCSPKYKKFKGKNIINLFNNWKNEGLCTIVEKNECYRSNQLICDFADKLYPNLTPTTSFNKENTEHDGVFLVNAINIETYIKKYNPVILRHSISSNTMGYKSINFGMTKGKTFERVLIFPTDPIKKYLKTTEGNTLTDISRAKLYVAITRAKSSVSFLYDNDSKFTEIKRFEK